LARPVQGFDAELAEGRAGGFDRKLSFDYARRHIIANLRFADVRCLREYQEGLAFALKEEALTGTPSWSFYIAWSLGVWWPPRLGD
jgi:hypothetical protein